MNEPVSIINDGALKMALIFFVPKQTSEVVIVKTTGVNKMPLGAKKCPMSPFNITIKAASPNAVVLFISFFSMPNREYWRRLRF